MAAANNVQTRPIDFYESSTSYKKMIRVTGWIYRFFRNVKSVPSNLNLVNHLSFLEINNAEVCLLKYVQKLCLSNESKIFYTSLQTIMDDHGIIRIRTRIALRKDLETFRYSIHLSCDHDVTYCHIFDKYKEFNHAGIQN